jgi:acetoin utilization deacetylase AcuC-like enzyme
VVGLKRVAIFDFDVIMGRHTESLMMMTGLLSSSHQFPQYPGKGFP